MTLPKTVFVCRKIPEAGLNLLSKAGFTLRIHSGEMPPTRSELLEGVRGCSAILSLLSDRIDAEVMDSAGNELRVIANFAVGFNNIDVAEAGRRAISVGNTPDVLTDATADIAVGLALAASRQFRAGMDAVRAGHWKTWEPLGWLGQELGGRTLGIVGMGRIGLAVAKRFHAGWGMKVVYTARSVKKDAQQIGAERVELASLLRQSDIVSLHVPLCEQTRNLIGTAEFASMKTSSVLVNTARGEIVDQSALIEALKNHSIFAAGLDVCTPEPLPPDHPLIQLPNCILLPHIGSATIRARDSMATRAAENILAGLAGTKLPYPVN